MRKTIDIDALLAKDILALTLNGKTYELEDVSISLFMMTVGEEPAGDILHEQLARVLKIDKDELTDVGLKAAALALKAIREWVTESSFADSEVTKTDSANP